MQSIERRVTPVLVAGGEASRVADDERLSAIADALVVDQDTGEIPQIIASVEVQSYIYYILPQAAIAKANVDLQSEAPDFETYQALVRERFPGGVDLIEEAKEILLDPTHSGGEGK